MKGREMVKRFILCGLIVLVVIQLCACGKRQGDDATELEMESTEAVAEDITADGQLPSEEEYITTFTYSDVTFVESIANQKAYGTTTDCTGMQGLAASEEYLYVAKQKDDRYAIIVQYDVKNDSQRTMEYYDSLEATEQTALNCVRHCNDMVVYTDGDADKYLFTAAGYNPDSGDKASPSLTRFLLNEEDATLRLAGFFNLTRINDLGEKVYLSASALREVAQTEEYHYFLIKNAHEFYWCKIPVGAVGGTMEEPQEVNCIHLFTIDTRNALFERSDGTARPIENLECWTNQGFGYSPEDDLIYVPLFNVSNGGLAGCQNVILTFRMDGMLASEALESVSENQEMRIFPSTLNFEITYVGQVLFEIESCVFMLNQGGDGNRYMYFNTNGSTVEKYEGIWQAEYTKGSVDTECIVDERDIIYTVNYDYNVDGTEKSDWIMNTSDSNYSMLKSTTHVAGITTNLRINCFMWVGYWFMGWNLHRESDDKWLYEDGNWYAEMEAPVGMEKELIADAEPVDNLTAVNGDVITAFAQWREY